MREANAWSESAEPVCVDADPGVPLADAALEVAEDDAFVELAAALEVTRPEDVAAAEDAGAVVAATDDAAADVAAAEDAADAAAELAAPEALPDAAAELELLR